jgi:hypothetical protein
VLDDALDGPILSGGISAFENNQDLVPVLDDVPLNFDELDLQVMQRGAVALTPFGSAVCVFAGFDIR